MNTGLSIGSPARSRYIAARRVGFDSPPRSPVTTFSLHQYCPAFLVQSGRSGCRQYHESPTPDSVGMCMTDIAVALHRDLSGDNAHLLATDILALHRPPGGAGDHVIALPG